MQENDLQQQSESHVLLPWLTNVSHAAPKIGPDTQLAACSCQCGFGNAHETIIKHQCSVVFKNAMLNSFTAPAHA